jgi:hypothetical protein
MIDPSVCRQRAFEHYRHRSASEPKLKFGVASIALILFYGGRWYFRLAYSLQIYLFGRSVRVDEKSEKISLIC